MNNKDHQAIAGIINANTVGIPMQLGTTQFISMEIITHLANHMAADARCKCIETGVLPHLVAAGVHDIDCDGGDSFDRAAFIAACYGETAGQDHNATPGRT